MRFVKHNFGVFFFFFRVCEIINQRIKCKGFDILIHLYIYVIIIRFMDQCICIYVIRITRLFVIVICLPYYQMINKLFLFIYCILHMEPESLYECVHSSSTAILF